MITNTDTEQFNILSQITLVAIGLSLYNSLYITLRLDEGGNLSTIYVLTQNCWISQGYRRDTNDHWYISRALTLLLPCQSIGMPHPSLEEENNALAMKVIYRITSFQCRNHNHKFYMASTIPLTLDTIQAARSRIAGFVHRTPVLTCSYLDQVTGFKLFFKCENLQKTGSFKVADCFQYSNTIY